MDTLTPNVNKVGFFYGLRHHVLADFATSVYVYSNKLVVAGPKSYYGLFMWAEAKAGVVGVYRGKRHRRFRDQIRAWS